MILTTNITVRNGIVLMLDALGIKNLSLHESTDFLSRWHELYEELDKLVTLYFSLDGINIEHRMPKIYVFGDTILCVWDIDKFSHDTAGTFHMAAYFAAHIIKLGIEKGILLRGAISSGEYCFKDDKNFKSFVGPAIADVASWYEEIDWFGIITTPHCHINVLVWADELTKIQAYNEQFIVDVDSDESNDKDHIDININDLCKVYSCKSKGGDISLRAINWPLLVYYEYKNESSKWLHNNISKLQIPKGVESKYFNTISYFDDTISLCIG